jgi:uncharacterized membrane protein
MNTLFTLCLAIIMVIVTLAIIILFILFIGSAISLVYAKAQDIKFDKLTREKKLKGTL